MDEWVQHGMRFVNYKKLPAQEARNHFNFEINSNVTSSDLTYSFSSTHIGNMTRNGYEDETLTWISGSHNTTSGNSSSSNTNKSSTGNQKASTTSTNGTKDGHDNHDFHSEHGKHDLENISREKTKRYDNLNEEDVQHAGLDSNKSNDGAERSSQRAPRDVGPKEDVEQMHG